MRLIVLVILASLVGYGVLQIDKIDPDNYVKMYLGNYVVEVKVLGFVLMLLALVLLLYFLLWLVRLFWRSPKIFSSWRNNRNRDKADEQLGAGYLSLIKGDWNRAESQLTKKSSYSHIPYVNFLAAAQAAQEQGRFEQRDDYLKAAYSAAPNERLAIGLTKAKLHERAGQVEQAMATLQDVAELGKKNPQYTAMVLQLNQRMDDWDAVQALIPAAKKQKALPESMLADLQSQVHFNALNSAQDKAAAWKALPRDQRRRIDNIGVYARDLVAKNELSAAEKLIRGTLGDDWSDELVDIYGQLQLEKPAKLLRKVEGWLIARPENAHLNLAAGRLAAADGATEVAEGHFKNAISLAGLPEAYTALGILYEANDKSSEALDMYRIGLQAVSDKAAAGNLDTVALTHEQDAGAEQINGELVERATPA